MEQIPGFCDSVSNGDELKVIQLLGGGTLPQINIAAEYGWLEDEVSLRKIGLYS